MKYLKLYENNMENQVEDAISEYNRIGDLIRDFIKLKYPKLDIRDVYHYYYDTNLEKSGDKAIITLYTNSNRQTSEEQVSMIYDKDLELLYEFMKDPEQYKSTKKYNI